MTKYLTSKTESGAFRQHIDTSMSTGGKAAEAMSPAAPTAASALTFQLILKHRNSSAYDDVIMMSRNAREALACILR